MRRIYIVLALLVFVGGAAIGIVNRQRKLERVALAEKCVTDVAELRLWLQILAAEGVMMPLYLHREDRIVEQKTPDLPLARVEARPAPLPFLDPLVLSKGRLAFGPSSAAAGDANEVFGVLRQLDASGLSPSFGFGGIGSKGEVHPFLFFVGADERWGDVVAIATSARDAGFAQAMFAFEVPSHVPAPPAGHGLDVMLAIANDVAQSRNDRERNASRRLIDDDTKKCPNLVTPLQTQPLSTLELDVLVKDFLEPAPDAIAGCGCRIDLDEVRAFAWTRFGRHWGKTTVTFTVPLAHTLDDEAPYVVTASADARWSEMAPRVIAASRENLDVRFAIKK